MFATLDTDAAEVSRVTVRDYPAHQPLTQNTPMFYYIRDAGAWVPIDDIEAWCRWGGSKVMLPYPLA